MTSTDTVPAEGSTHADAPASRIVDGDYNSFRRHIRAGALSLLILTLAAGLFARQQQHAILEYAVNVYDTAFISTNYIHLAQVCIASAVEQQTQAAQKIATNLTSASANVVDFTGAIVKVERVGIRTAQAADMVTSASVSVTNQAKRFMSR
jgi:hypothetical protein